MEHSYVMDIGHYLPEQEDQYEIIPEKPNWEETPAFLGTFLPCEAPASLDEITENVETKRKSSEPSISKIAPQPFAKGSIRYAYYGLDISETPDHDPIPIVLKEFSDQELNEDIKNFEIHDQLQLHASFLARRFCQEVDTKAELPMTIQISKTKTLSIRVGNGNGHRYMSCEKRYPLDSMQFVKFTNSADHIISEAEMQALKIGREYVDLLLAFSHWTYQATERKLMIADLQGLVHHEGEKVEILLTNPTFHCEEKNPPGETNRGHEGMREFFIKHECNQFCEKLGLERVKLEEIGS